MRRLYSIALVALATGLVRGRADASQFFVSPITVTFPVGATSSLLTLTNRSPKEPARLQITAFAWDQSPSGEMKLAPTRDIVFFPSLITLAPQESRKLRVGLATPAQGVEKTYRVFIEELGTPPTPGKTEVVRVLTRMGVPIFAEGSQVTRKPAIEAPQLKGNHATFNVTNAGTAHFLLRKIRLVGKNAAGAIVFSKEEAGWYILANGLRAYDVELPKDACSAKEVSIELETDLTQPVRTSIASPGCG